MVFMVVVVHAVIFNRPMCRALAATPLSDALRLAAISIRKLNLVFWRWMQQASRQGHPFACRIGPTPPPPSQVKVISCSLPNSRLRDIVTFGHILDL